VIEDAIAKLLAEHFCEYISGTCLCGVQVANVSEHANHVAALLVSELGLVLA
jgi:hypothetical protein